MVTKWSTSGHKSDNSLPKMVIYSLLSSKCLCTFVGNQGPNVLFRGRGSPSRFPCHVFHICNFLIFVMKYNWSIQMQNHQNKSQLRRVIDLRSPKADNVSFVTVFLTESFRKNECLFGKKHFTSEPVFFSFWMVLKPFHRYFLSDLSDKASQLLQEMSSG